MSDINSKLSRAFKTTKEITSKINSGLPRRAATPTTSVSRQISRTTSRQSTMDITESRPTSWSRPVIKKSSSLLSSTSKIGIPDDKIQQGLHKPGTLPKYLRSKRPATVHSSFKPTDVTKRKNDESHDSSQKQIAQDKKRFDKFKADIGEKIQKYSNSKEALTKDSRIQSDQSVIPAAEGALEQAIAHFCAEPDQIVTTEGPPCGGAGDVNQVQTLLLTREAELTELNGKMRQLEEKCNCLEEDCRTQIERALDLDCQLRAKTALVQEREAEIDKLKAYVDNLRAISTSRETVSHESIREQDKLIAELRAELAQKYTELNNSNKLVTSQSTRLEKLKTQLIEVSNAREKEETDSFEIAQKLAEKETALDAALDENKRLTRCNQERKSTIEKLQQQISTMSSEIAAKDTQIASLKASGAVELPTDSQKDSPEAQRIKLVETLQLELETLRNDYNILQKMKQQDDVLLQIRSKLLDNLGSIKESFKARCEALTRDEGGEDEDDGRPQRTIEGFEMLCDTVAEKQRQCCEEEKIISEIEQNNRKCKAVRWKMLEKLKELTKENRTMKEIMSNGDSDLSMVDDRKAATANQSQLKEQILGQICQLFPDEVPVSKHRPEDDASEEKITSRIIYEEQIDSEPEPSDMELLL
ncbi:ankyrin repeat domain-containing protein 24-like isoform X2 [Topomyia yanbarensis]|uniref:ankyrin repeat domain-containing protein 24-like isoform X2 n=2 Tax=Topomyia yanbarensis TaxID=2498891 RepID=UPI00273B436B|nr:ankyrin repeat domain-containing protein 24-like isoform X2 [Topomyia yanbarensis]XP_058840112.1 ankyrin repeat domain-containing protein 24-like isoform X2 [Topomyia yanbarensis]